MCWHIGGCEVIIIKYEVFLWYYQGTIWIFVWHEEECLFVRVIIAYSADSGMIVKKIVSQKREGRGEFMILKNEILRSYKLKETLVCALVEAFDRGGVVSLGFEPRSAVFGSRTLYCRKKNFDFFSCQY